jgi:uncharacterized membrane protein YoaK (UPF0700 family)
MGSRGEPAETGASAQPEPSLVAVRDILIVVLAATSGYVDAVSYLGLGRVFTSNMTGNTVLLGLALGQAQGIAALRSLVALAGYLCGVATATLIVEPKTTDKPSAIWPIGVTRAFAFECAVLAVFAVGGILARTADSASAIVYPLIALSATAMGIQSVAVRELGVSGITTTYITGTWTSLIGESVIRARSRLRPARPATPAPARPHVRHVQAAVLAVYVLAAVVGGLAESRWLLAAAVLPVVAVALVVAVAWRRLPRGG